MKKILYITIIALLFTSCDDFLEPKSQDKIIPVKVSQLKEFLLGEVIAREFNDDNDYLRFLPMMTDDMFYYIIPSQRRDIGAAFFGYYSWQRDPEIGKNNYTEVDHNWEGYYHDVFTCNVILDQIDDMEGTDAEKYELYAQTYFMRANSYFMLVNLYGEPYEKATASDALGIPINNEAGIENNYYQRSSVEAVYKKIEEDLLLSIENFKKVNVLPNVALPTLNAAYLLTSRMYLYKKEYKLAKDYADLVIGNMQGNLVNLNSFDNDYFLCSGNSEIIFTYGVTKDYLYRKSSSMSAYILTDDFKSLFDADDLRYDNFFPRDDYKKYFKGKCGCYGKVFRLAEAHLNRAEAFAYLDEVGDAMDDINEIRRNRFENGKDYELDTDDKQAAINYIRNERRMELSFEYHRWFDLRRYGMPRLVHKYGFPGEEVEYVLEEKSKAYTLPIPLSVTRLNKVIEQIDRPDMSMEN